MRLINPGAGEISDRLTILALKIHAGQEQGKEVSHFEIERAALLTQIRSRTLNGKWFEAVLELAVVNGAIWHAEDDLRTHRKAHAELVADPRELQQLTEAVRLAFRLQTLNDRRAELVGQINQDAGDGAAKEKG